MRRGLWKVSTIAGNIVFLLVILSLVVPILDVLVLGGGQAYQQSCQFVV